MPITYTVKTARKTKDVPDNGYGPKQDIELILDGPDGEVKANWFTNATTPVPVDGSSVMGDISPGPYGLKFKKAGGFGGGGGTFRPRDPGEIAAIIRQHSQGVAVKLIELGLTAGVIVPPTDGKELLALVAKTCDWLDRDVAAAKERGK